MAGLLDFLTGQTGAAPLAGLLNLPQGEFPPGPKPADPQAIWSAIEAENAQANAAADRRNAAGLAAAGNPAPVAQSFAAPDAAAPGVAYAMGQRPDNFGV